MAAPATPHLAPEPSVATEGDTPREIPAPKESHARIAGAAMDRVDAIDVGFDLSYVWDYTSQRADLDALYEKAKEHQWNARKVIAWDTPVDPEAETIPNQFIPIFGTRLWDKLDKKTELPKLRRHATSYLLSNFLHGEQGALMVASQIVGAVPSIDAKLYAATQAMDEARHVEAYERYLREKVELTYPVSPHLRTLLDEIMRERRWDMKYLGMQILIEGLALAAFGLIVQTSTEPLITQIVKLIMQDEARHVAFGVLSLKGIYSEMSAGELRDREDFILSACRLMRDRFLMQEVWEELGMPTAECLEAVRESKVMALFQSLLFSKIVPNVKRLGLLTPNVRKGFEELQVIQYETWDATA